MSSEDILSVTLNFVIPKKYSNENRCSDDMKVAFQTCLDNELIPHWVPEDECAKLSTTKQDVFVFEKFEGELFRQLQSQKCLLLGPRCLTSCLMDKRPIPESNSPVFTTAMRELIISITNFLGDEKEDIIKKVQYMGGFFTTKLIASTTHLVAKNVISIKYEKAVEKGLPVMTEEWVNAVWEASCERNVHGKDPQFEKYKCPVFHGLTVTCSNLQRAEKEEIRSLIDTNGGTFNGQLECEVTKLLVIKTPTGDKYKYAREWKLPCVVPAWVRDSVKQGYALRVESYFTPEPLPGVRCSTPNSDESRLHPDFSIVSTVSVIPGNNKTHVNETVSADSTIQSFLTKKPHRQQDGVGTSKGSFSKHAETLEKLNLKEVKMAGTFLDGCIVYLSGFTPEQSEKLKKVMKAGGATRLNDISDCVTHFIVGNIVPADMRMLKEIGSSPYILSVDWVLESIKQKQPAPEENFLCSTQSLQTSEPPSPLSKKGLQMLRKSSSSERTIPPFNLSDDDRENSASDVNKGEEVNLVDQYLQSAQQGGENLEGEKTLTLRGSSGGCGGDCKDKPLHGYPSISDSESTQDLRDKHLSDSESTQDFTENSAAPIFSDLTFFIIDYEEGIAEELKKVIESRGGRVVGKSFKGVVDYAIVPLQGAKIPRTVSEIVTYVWVEDCHTQDDVLPVQYFHRPISSDFEKKPLTGCVIAISSYVGTERDFLFAVAESLGAKTQEMFARKANEKKNALASTHLICSEPGSQKYNAALKWNLPAVNHEWLLACARESRLVDEKPYLVGESTAESSSRRAGGESHAERTETPRPADRSAPSAAAGTPRSAERSAPSPAAGTPRPAHKRLEELQEAAVMGPPPSPKTPRRMVTPSKENYGFSQESPIVIPRLECTPKLGWPKDRSQPTPKGPFHINTPETPYGQSVMPNPSPETRKRWKRWIDDFPDLGREESSPPRKRRNSTPLSELKRRVWEKMKKNIAEHQDDGSTKPHDQNEPSTSGSTLFQKTDERTASTSSPAIAVQLNQLNEVLHKQQSKDDSRDTPVLKRLRTSEPAEPMQESGPVKLTFGKESQGEVDWMDPAEASALRKKMLEAQRVKETQYRFMLSGIQDREQYEEIIKDLGGQVTGMSVFDPTSSHLVCSRPVRSEKLLASIASGKWVLHKSYLDASHKAGKFLEEEEYEWGNPSATQLMRDLKPGSLESELSLAAHRWRCRLANEDEGAFRGMRALVSVSAEREDPFKRLILAGSGRLVDFSQLDDATHCFVELNKVPLPVDMAVLVEKRIPCVPPLYLNDYLIKDPPPQAHSSVVPEYRRLVGSG